MNNEPAIIKHKNIMVTCALIEDDLGAVFAAQRSPVMNLPLKWEFPGGKVEKSETYEQTIEREIQEELNVKIRIIDKLPSFIHHYDSSTITLIPFVCKIKQGEIILSEHQAFCWVNPNNLLDLDWAAADIPVANYYLNTLKK